MNRFKTVMTVLLLALWLPATSHELLEHVGWIHTAHTDNASSADDDNDHDAADGTCAVTSNHVDVPQPDLTGGLPLARAAFALTLTALLEGSSALPNGPDPPSGAPPELSHTWQFSFRASLPPRAPSMIS